MYSNTEFYADLTEYCREEFEKFTAFLTSKKCQNWPVFRVKLVNFLSEKGRFSFLLRSLHFGSNRLSKRNPLKVELKLVTVIVP